MIGCYPYMHMYTQEGGKGRVRQIKRVIKDCVVYQASYTVLSDDLYLLYRVGKGRQAKRGLAYRQRVSAPQLNYVMTHTTCSTQYIIEFVHFYDICILIHVPDEGIDDTT